MANVDWGKIGAIVNSQGFSTAVGAVGAGLSASAASKSNAQNSAQAAAQFAAEMAQRQQESGANQRLSAATAAANASPLGANENFALRQAMLRSILPQLRNAKITPGDPAVAKAMGTSTGGLRLPEGGLPASALASLSEAATAGAIGQRQQHISNIDPNAPGINLGRMGFTDPAALGVQGETDAYHANAQAQAVDQQNATAAQLQAALEQNYAAGDAGKEKKKGRSIWAKLGSVAKVAVPIVLAATGVGAPAAAAIMAGTYAASKKADGGSWGDAAKAGVVGGVTGGVGAGALGAAGGSAGQMSGISQAGLGLGKQATSEAVKAAAMKGGQNIAQNLATRLAQQGQQAPAAPPPNYRVPNTRQGAVDPRLLQQALRRQQFGG